MKSRQPLYKGQNGRHQRVLCSEMPLRACTVYMYNYINLMSYLYLMITGTKDINNCYYFAIKLTSKLGLCETTDDRLRRMSS